MKPNKKHKDSVFSTLFNNPEALRELYSAIEGIHIPQDMQIDINTLSDVLIRGQINDLSFTIDNRLVVLIEHQSTISENLPLRLLEYIGKVYEKTVKYERRFQKNLTKIPKPEFIVLYNGNEAFPDHKVLRLSDAFMDVQGLKLSCTDELPLELVVQVYNINQGHNPQMLKKSATLNSYSFLISKIWEYRNSKFTLEDSLRYAIQYCIDNNVLRDFLRKHGSEVYSMLYGEYRIEDEIAVVKEEVREEVRKETWKEAWEKCSEEKDRTTARNLLTEGS
ncbi:MAG: Rpn family recombination-promoting nuclease/putative transposase, partial [Treponema sp.]|nr:Rpn family recombination-promoting nuclease/putative transposase [Treponema sp.]